MWCGMALWHIYDTKELINCREGGHKRGGAVGCVPTLQVFSHIRRMMAKWWWWFLGWGELTALIFRAQLSLSLGTNVGETLRVWEQSYFLECTSPHQFDISQLFLNAYLTRKLFMYEYVQIFIHFGISQPVHNSQVFVMPGGGDGRECCTVGLFGPSLAGKLFHACCNSTFTYA